MSMALRHIIPALGILSVGSTAETASAIPAPAIKVRKRRKDDPRIVMQFRLERRVRRAIAHRKRYHLPELTEDEVRVWAAEEAKRLGLELKEASDVAEEPDT